MNDAILYRTARVERSFRDRKDMYWVSIKDIGTRTIVLAGGEKPLKLGQDITVWWFPKGRCWIKK